MNKPQRWDFCSYAFFLEDVVRFMVVVRKGCCRAMDAR